MRDAEAFFKAVYEGSDRSMLLSGQAVLSELDRISGLLDSTDFHDHPLRDTVDLGWLHLRDMLDAVVLLAKGYREMLEIRGIFPDKNNAEYDVDPLLEGLRQNGFTDSRGRWALARIQASLPVKIHQRTLSRILKGEQVPRLAHAVALCGIAGVDSQQLFREDTQ